MIANYHTHTSRCNHAVGTEEDYIRCAIDSGIQILGFSDHSPYPFPAGYYTHMRMFPDALENYTKTLCTLRKQYEDQIQLHIGLEAEYYPAYFQELLAMVRDTPTEYFILGQHWCGNEINEPYNGRPTEDEAFLARYCDQVIAAVETGLFSYVAHPDLLHFVGEEKIYARHMRRLCRGVNSCNIPVEINFGGLRSGSHYPNRAFWRVAAEENCRVVLGVDAHSPENLSDRDTEQKACALAAEFGIVPEKTITLRPLI